MPKKFHVKLTEEEMQTVANAIAAFYNVQNQTDTVINASQTVCLQGVMEKFKKAIDGRTSDIILTDDRAIIT